MDSVWIHPDWPAPASVRAVVTTRHGPGVSLPPRERLNLGLNTDDVIEAVQENRRLLVRTLDLPSAPCWLRQVHGTKVVDPDSVASAGEPEADGAVTAAVGTVLAILTADCLPVLLCSRDGRQVGAVHAGWRGLAAGIIEAGVRAFSAPPAELLAWLGPCIGAASYEIDAEVREAFVRADATAEAAFTPNRPEHWLCSLELLARQRLRQLGVHEIHGGGFDTRTDPRFYSWRRDGANAGRFASIIWVSP